MLSVAEKVEPTDDCVDAAMVVSNAARNMFPSRAVCHQLERHAAFVTYRGG
jgi:hypothetical protein